MNFTTNVEDVIGQIQDYTTKLISDIQVFLNELADIGIDAADVIVRSAMSTPSAETTYEEQQRGVYGEEYLDVNPPTKTGVQVMKSKYSARFRIKIKLSGPDVLFLEFSAGIRSGRLPGEFPTLPTGKSYGDGYGVGTYNPTSGNAMNPDGWFFEEAGISWHSFGNRAYAPMYHADEAIFQNVKSVAKRVFG